MKYLYILFLSLIVFNCFAQTPDINALKEIHVNRNKNLDGTMKFISNSQYIVGLGTPLTFIGIGFAKHDKKMIEQGAIMLGALALNTTATYILKYAINRDRPVVTYPYLQPLANEQSRSFPSGHTSNSFCTAMNLSLSLRKWYVVVPAFAWASAVGYSRMHMGVHYPTDVIAGSILGVGSSLITFKANQYLRKRVLKKHPKGYLIWYP